MPSIHPDTLFRALTDAAEIGMVLIDGDGRIVLWNDWMAKASAIPAATALGATMTGVFPQLAASRIVSAVDDALARGMSAILSSSLNKKLFPLVHESRAPGRSEPMHQIVVIKPVPDAALRACLVQVFDVTNMAHREALLRQQARTMEALAENYRLSELHNRAIVDNTADAIITFGEDGAIGTYNPAAERMFGYDPVPDRRQVHRRLDPGTGGCGKRPAPGQRSGPAARDHGHAQDPRDLPAGIVGQRHGTGRPAPVRRHRPRHHRTQGGGRGTASAKGMADHPDQRHARSGVLQGRQEPLAGGQRVLSGYRRAEGRGLPGPHRFELARLSRDQGEMLRASSESDERAWREGRPVSYEKEVSTPERGAKVFDVVKIPLFNDDGSRRGLVLVGRDVTERKLAAARIHHLAITMP